LQAISMAEALPIVFINFGFSAWLIWSIKQARAWNPESPIFLITDHPFRHNSDCTHVPAALYMNEAAFFRKHYRHQSTNPELFELVCFVRWFVLLRFMQEHGFARVLTLDSDVMLYCNATEEQKLFEHADISLAKAQSPHVAFVNNWAAIEDFCIFLVNCYANEASPEYAWRRQIRDNVSDMAMLGYYFARNGRTFAEIAGVVNDATHDNSMLDLSPPLQPYAGEEFILGDDQKLRPVKKVAWDGGTPYCRHLELKKDIRFKSLHFQGCSKLLQPNYFRAPTTPAAVK
jgi:hypothetical protein